MKRNSNISNQTYVSYGTVYQLAVHSLNLARELGSVLPMRETMKPAQLRASMTFQSAYLFACHHAANYERIFNPRRFKFGTPLRQTYWAHGPLMDGGLPGVTKSVDLILETLEWTSLCNSRESADTLAGRMLSDKRRAVVGFKRIESHVLDNVDAKATALRNAVYRIFSELPVQDRTLDTRNKWIYEQCCTGDPYEVILRRLKSKQFSGQINAVQSLIKAAKRYAAIWGQRKRRDKPAGSWECKSPTGKI